MAKERDEDRRRFGGREMSEHTEDAPKAKAKKKAAAKAGKKAAAAEAKTFKPDPAPKPAPDAKPAAEAKPAPAPERAAAPMFDAATFTAEQRAQIEQLSLNLAKAALTAQGAIAEMAL